jgi:3-hydroxymyristoyl/3-hydroxydecanoyl-(acyl carrier protein) dehydratase
MKFLSAVRPEEEILLRAEKLAQVGELWQFKTQASVGGKIVAEGQLVLNLTSQSSFAGPE